MKKCRCVVVGVLAMFLVCTSLFSGCSNINNSKTSTEDIEKTSSTENINSQNDYKDLSKKSNSTGNEFYTEINNNKYYLQAYMILNLNDENNIHAVGTKQNSHEYSKYKSDILPISLNNDNSVIIGNVIYATETYYDYENGCYLQDIETNKRYRINKYTIGSDGNTLTKELFIDYDALANSDVAMGDRYWNSMTNWETDGKDIFFVNVFYSQYGPKSNKYRLGKVSVDTGEIELFDDITVENYTLDGDYIYYYDNGYTYYGNQDYGFDENRVGLYRMNKDKSDKERIYSDFKYLDPNIETYEGLCKNIKVFGEYIYFIDSSINGEHKLCRVKKDGSDYTVISKKAVFSYTYDEESQKIYYLSNEVAENKNDNEYENNYGRKYGNNFKKDQTEYNVYEISLLEEERKINLTLRDNSKIDYQSGCLYVSDSENLSINYIGSYNEVVGIIYDIDNEKTKRIKGKYIDFITTDAEGFELTNYEGPYFIME